MMDWIFIVDAKVLWEVVRLHVGDRHVQSEKGTSLMNVLAIQDCVQFYHNLVWIDEADILDLTTFCHCHWHEYT